MSKKDCAKNICELCTNAVLVKGLFGIKYSCIGGHKKSQGVCYYFKCKGKEDNYKCSSCPSRHDARYK